MGSPSGTNRGGMSCRRAGREYTSRSRSSHFEGYLMLTAEEVANPINPCPHCGHDTGLHNHVRRNGCAVCRAQRKRCPGLSKSTEPRPRCNGSGRFGRDGSGFFGPASRHVDGYDVCNECGRMIQMRRGGTLFPHKRGANKGKALRALRFRQKAS